MQSCFCVTPFFVSPQVSRATCTLPPSGKNEAVKLRRDGHETKPRPKSSHVSPYRGMQARNHTPNYYRAKSGYRSGSMSPNSTSPTRYDTRSLPRMTGAKLSLKAQSPTSCSSNNSSADESVSGGLSTYKRLVSKRSLSRSGVKPSSRPLSPTNHSVQADSEESANEVLSEQLKSLGKYLEKKQSSANTDTDSAILDPQMDEYLANIRKALAKSAK